MVQHNSKNTLKKNRWPWHMKHDIFGPQTLYKLPNIKNYLCHLCAYLNARYQKSWKKNCWQYISLYHTKSKKSYHAKRVHNSISDSKLADGRYCSSGSTTSAWMDRFFVDVVISQSSTFFNSGLLCIWAERKNYKYMVGTYQPKETNKMKFTVRKSVKTIEKLKVPNSNYWGCYHFISLRL